LVRKSVGPGWIEWIIKAPIRKTSMTEPGMPMEMRGTSAPPTVALFAVSDATMPSSEPLPNFSGSFETFFAVV
jgi:hypothetical protein